MDEMDVYIRVSQLGDRDEEESTEIYEAQCRDWANRNEVIVGLVEDDTDVKGSVAVADRKLEKLVRRVEQGESTGIITPYLDRFGRDLIEGAVALKRISDADGKLVAVKDGFDSTSPGSELVFNLRMAIAQDYLKRVRENFQEATKRAVKRGVWLWPRVPFGYEKDEKRQLVVVEAEAEVVREIFKRRAAGATLASLPRWMNSEHGDVVREQRERNRRNEKKGKWRPTISRNGIRSILRTRAYVGEMIAPTDKKGQTRVVKNHVPAILTESEWQAAQIKAEFSPRNGRASAATLRGLVWCSSCGRRCKVGANGKGKQRALQYVCTGDGCPYHVGIRADLLEDHVSTKLTEAAMSGDPHIAAIIEGDSRYEDALKEVKLAQETFEEFRDDVGVQKTLGIEGFAAGLKVRKEALTTARRHLAEVRPASGGTTGKVKLDTREQVETAMAVDANQRFVGKIVVHPARVDGGIKKPAERVEIFWKGSAEPA